MPFNNTDRTKDTRVFDDRDGNGDQFGLMALPSEFAITPDRLFKRHCVRQFEVGFLDLIANLYYGPGNEPLWWMIALVNGFIDPELDMYPGQIVLIPPVSLVSTFSSRGSNAT